MLKKALILMLSLYGVTSCFAAGVPTKQSAGPYSLLAPGVRLTQTIWVPGKEQVSCLGWSPSGKTLLYATESHIYLWPSGRRIRVPWDSAFSQVRWSPDGKKVLLDGAWQLTVRTMALRRLPASSDVAWWSGDGIAYLRSERSVRPKGRDRAYVRMGSRRAWLPDGVITHAADSTGMVVLGRSRTAPGEYSHVTLFQVNPQTLHLTPILQGETSGSEYTAHDSVAWNDHLKAAALAVTTDTGATIAALSILDQRGVWDIEDKGWMVTKVESEPQWVGRRVLATLRAYDERPFGRPRNLREAYSLELIDPHDRSRTILVASRREWSVSADGNSQKTLTSGPILGPSAASPDGSKVAYVRRWDYYGKPNTIQLCRCSPALVKP